ncbi:DNA-binding response regulator, LuxR family [uncultured Defluviicoccus sp.]|uniref:DNA-binding response regulator, LuxR family n=1 Tax=metagenome TaxID=256318 RepID=A0A380T9M5_9ZZZZ|nr:DNA-binding response regulator, LuxR family [uncultured Defluviicoccus sp.]
MPEPLISIIDDDDSLRAALVGLVRSLGYKASEFASAEEFLAAAPASACIVTDIQMPGISGIDLKNELVRKGDATPVIMITARAEPGLEQRARASGASCFLRKPFEASDLVSCIESALARTR